MNTGLKSGKNISCATRRFAEKQAAGIRKHLQRKRILRKLDSVHSARKHIKKLRALLRLIREKLGDKTYHRQNAALRKLGRALSGVRNVTVHLKTLTVWHRRHARQLPQKEFEALQKILQRQRAERLRTLQAAKVLRCGALKSLERKINNWNIKNLKTKDFFIGIEKARHRFMDAQQQARFETNDETIHAWRKRTKDLLYQSGFLKNWNAKFFSRRIQGLKKLAKDLGDAHDLAMLEINNRKLRLTDELLKAMHARKVQLQNDAFALAEKNKIFAGKSFFPDTH